MANFNKLLEQRLDGRRDSSFELLQIACSSVDFDSFKEVPRFGESERLSGPDDPPRPEQFHFHVAALDIDLIVDPVVGIGCAILMREALDKEGIADEMGTPTLLVAEPELLGVGEGRIGTKKNVLEADGEAGVLEVSKGAESQGLCDRDILVVGLKRDTGYDRGSALHNGDGPGSDIDGPEIVAGNSLLEEHLCTRGR
jgi:hypothetical protein